MVFLGRDDGGVGYVETAKVYRESRSLSRSLITALPVMAGTRRCLIASSKGCRELVRGEWFA